MRNIDQSRKIFISYSSRDKIFVEKLVTDFKERNINIWYDAFEMTVGDSLTKKIQEGIKSSSYLAVVLSPNSVDSKWVKIELQAAMNREIVDRSMTILPVLYRPCKLPAFLRDKVYADFHSNYSKGLEQLLFAIGSSASKSPQDERDLLSKITLGLIVDRIEQFSILELSELVKRLEEQFGVSTTAPPSFFAGQLAQIRS
jgi:hypothetical protein